MQLFRFALVGGIVALTYIALYLLFLAVGMPQIAANACAFLLAIAVQYVGQGRFTFGKRLKDREQGLRFVVMVSLGLLTAALITGWIAKIVGLSDAIAALIVTVVLPVQNYLIMSNWVFKNPDEQLG